MLLVLFRNLRSSWRAQIKSNQTISQSNPYSMKRLCWCLATEVVFYYLQFDTETYLMIWYQHDLKVPVVDMCSLVSWPCLLWNQLLSLATEALTMSATSFVLILPLDKIEDCARLSWISAEKRNMMDNTHTTQSTQPIEKMTLLVQHKYTMHNVLMAFLHPCCIRGSKPWRSWSNIQVPSLWKAYASLA